MPTEITMPKLSDTMTEGKLISWKKSPGARVERGEIIAEVETDKANMELEAFASGILLETRAKEGDTVPVGTVIGVIGEPGEQTAPPQEKPAPELQPQPAPPAGAPEEKPGPVKEEGTAEGRPEEVALRKEEGLQDLGEGVTAATTAPSEHPAVSQVEQSPPTEKAAPAEPPKAPAPREAEEVVASSPLVRRLARERGIDLTEVQGSGPDGRVLAEDLEKHRPAEKAPAPAAPEPKGGREPLSRIRGAIARGVAQTWQNVPHFFITVEADMARAEGAYHDLKRAGKTITLNDLIVKACALALVKHPAVNASFAGDAIARHEGVHVGVAVALEEGLVIPVIRDCHRLSLLEIGARSSDLISQARAGRLSEADMSGGTFTVSNLGMYGVDEFAAIIHAPEAAILAVGAVADRPVVRDGLIVPGRTMRMTLSCDHRALDGAAGAVFMAELKGILESPALLFAG